MSVSLRPDDLTLVTGGSGFLGSAVVRALIGRGLRVRALVRATSPRDNFVGLDCEVVVGDLTDRESLKAALKDVRYLFHVAADYRLWARNPSEIIRANVEGTVNLKREALAAGVERIVYTSSVAALRVAGATVPVDETAALLPRRGNRRLQAQQDHGRARRRGNDPARRVCRRSSSARRRPSDHATSGRHQPAVSCSTRRAAGSRPSSTRD